MPAHDDWLRFITALNALAVEYMVSGSVASIFYGEPRMTNDIDIVIFLKDEQLEPLAKAFSIPQFYCPPFEVIRTEQRRTHRGHFNIIHIESGFKADIYLSGSDPLHQWAIARAKRITVESVPVVLAPPEYVIIRKLQFYEEGLSDKHLRDIRAIMAVSASVINHAELHEQIEKYHLQATWEKATDA